MQAGDTVRDVCLSNGVARCVRACVCSTVGDVSEGPCVDEHGRLLDRLHERGHNGILHEHC